MLAPFVPEAQLAAVFGGSEPLTDPTLLETFRRLLALTPDAKPWECVGDEAECRVAARMATERVDRRGNAVLAALVAESAGVLDPTAEALLEPLSAHHVPDRYAPDALVV